MVSLRIRAALVGLASVAALALSSSALAAFTTSPRLFASQSQQAGRVNLLYTQSIAEDPVARIVHHVPTPYRTNLSARPAGTLVGTAVLRGNPTTAIGDNPANENLVLSGTIEAVGADTVHKVNGKDVRVSAAATSCIGKALGERGQYWLLRLKDAGGDVSYDVPVFVERLSDQTDFGADATISTCFGPPDVAESNPNRSPGGLRVREFELQLNRVFTSPKDGLQRWSTLATPYQPRTGRVNEAGTVELQSIVSYPRTISVAAPVRTKLTAGFATYRFTGNVALPPHDRAGSRTGLYRGFDRTQVGSRTANAFPIFSGKAGRYTKLHTIRRVAKQQSFMFQVRAYVRTAIYGRAGCAANYHPNVTCIQTTRAGYLVRSRNVSVKVPAR